MLKADLSSVSIVGWHKLPAHVKTGIPVEAHIAQSVEHFLGKEEVIGSNPIVSTIYKVRVVAAAESGDIADTQTADECTEEAVVKRQL